MGRSNTYILELVRAYGQTLLAHPRMLDHLQHAATPHFEHACFSPFPNRSGTVSGPALPTPLSRPATHNPSLLRSHALNRCFALLASRGPPYFDRTPRFDSNAPREPLHTFLTFSSRFALCTGVYPVLSAALFRCGCCLILTGGAHWASMAARSPGCACPHAQNGKIFFYNYSAPPSTHTAFPKPSCTC